MTTHGATQGGKAISNNFVALTDNKHLEGADYIVPVIRKSVDTAGVAKVLNEIDAKLTTPPSRS